MSSFKLPESALELLETPSSEVPLVNCSPTALRASSFLDFGTRHKRVSCKDNAGHSPHRATALSLVNACAGCCLDCRQRPSLSCLGSCPDENVANRLYFRGLLQLVTRLSAIDGHNLVGDQVTIIPPNTERCYVSCVCRWTKCYARRDSRISRKILLYFSRPPLFHSAALPLERL